MIVTFNLADFPPAYVWQFGIEVQHTDQFLNHQRSLSEPLFLQCVKRIRARLSKTRYTPEAYIDNLRSCGLQIIAAELDNSRALI